MANKKLANLKYVKTLKKILFFTFFLVFVFAFFAISKDGVLAGCITHEYSLDESLQCPQAGQHCQWCGDLGCWNWSGWCVDCGAGMACISCEAHGETQECQIICVGTTPECVPKQPPCDQPCGSCFECNAACVSAVALGENKSFALSQGESWLAKSVLAAESNNFNPGNSLESRNQIKASSFSASFFEVVFLAFESFPKIVFSFFFSLLRT